ncbi:MAG: sodium transporter [Candidatus Hydrogenedentota bacterium]|nr:MAG: sodium transporter [Candidatus Hydrogenedentota bacterium]
MSFLDWLIIFSYFVFTLIVGFFLRSKAGESIRSYFTANRTFPWWVAGTSMVATTFAADTPLAITGIVAKDGISGNWFWWSWVFTFILMSVVFAKRWQRSGLITDVELCELRYSGKPAEVLRITKAIYLGVILNSLILGWVFKAMSKISAVFVHWDAILGKEAYSQVQSFWPHFLVIGDLNNTITVFLLLLIVLVYSSQAGIRGVMITDVFQFLLGMLGAIVLPIYAIHQIGGMGELFRKLHLLYGEKANHILSFWPSFGEGQGSLPFKVFLIFMGVQWWSKYFSDGSGYLAQRIQTCRSEKDAMLASLWFSFAHFILRTWPWVLAALAALVIFPLGNPDTMHSLGSKLIVHGNEDREMAYPLLILQVLPTGIIGIAVTGLVAAFMSTVDTHINWGSSYLMNDIYKRILRPKATEKELVRVSRITVFLLGLLSIFISSQIDSIESAWKFFLSVAAGAGLPQLLRWFWWRANAYTELTGMLSALILSFVLYTIFPKARAEYLLFFIAFGSSGLAIIVTLLTRTEPKETLSIFYEKLQPSGFWKAVNPTHSHAGWIKEIKLWASLSLFLFVLLYASYWFSIG